MDSLVDDVGSFPLPPNIDRKVFDKAYTLARDTIIHGQSIRENEFLNDSFHRVVVDSFKKKHATGLDVVNYPQHYDMNKQFTDVIHQAMNKGTYIVAEKEAIIPEVHVINEEAKDLAEETGKKILLRVSVTGPMELYLKEVGTTPYKDILLMFAETVRRFAKNSMLNSKHIKTEAISLDEPSFGFQDIPLDRDSISDILEKAFDFQGVAKQIHLHASSRVADILSVKNVDVLSFEYAASPKNIDAVSRRMLDDADKRVRVGVSRTDIDSIRAELQENAITKPTSEQLVESEETIRKRYLAAERKYGERMSFTGPDCGLGGWPSQDAAQLLLSRTVQAIKTTRTDS
jgi:5-methyltetrahydropteroyltriglutamate--homocysteine methyltransferase